MTIILIDEFFSGFTLSEIVRYYDLEMLGLDSSKRTLTRELAVACSKLLYFAIFRHNSEAEYNDGFEKLTLKRILNFDVWNKNIFDILNSNKKFKALELIYELVVEYNRSKQEERLQKMNFLKSCLKKANRVSSRHSVCFF